jgi:hypothetical protein
MGPQPAAGGLTCVNYVSNIKITQLLAVPLGVIFRLVAREPDHSNSCGPLP